MKSENGAAESMEYSKPRRSARLITKPRPNYYGEQKRSLDSSGSSDESYGECSRPIKRSNANGLSPHAGWRMNGAHIVEGNAGGVAPDIPGLVCKDISNGKEDICIPVINTCDDPPIPPEGFTYINCVQAAANIAIPPNAPGCNCKGRCRDPRTCSCAQLNGFDFPYVSKDGGRLTEAQDVVFECGPTCGCGPKCINRVSQRGLKYQLEVYKTPDKGWAVRTRDFIPSGAPVCEYIGILRRNKDLDNVSENEYIFEIDCWHTMNEIGGRERRLCDDNISSNGLENKSDFQISSGDGEKKFDVCTPTSDNKKKSDPAIPSSDKEEKPNIPIPSNENKKESEFPIHSDDKEKKSNGEISDHEPEFCIDAASFGNVTRFINHSCEPNLFVQCVLNSHHDMRLARVVLFASDDILPMQELTYDYGYALDSVIGPGGKIKESPCFCGTEDCRKRLY